jgi:hypothetical protein
MHLNHSVPNDAFDSPPLQIPDHRLRVNNYLFSGNTTVTTTGAEKHHKQQDKYPGH